MNKVLSTKNLVKEYQIDETIIKAVDDVSIELKSGEFVALVGPSGSGKTSMLAMIAGLLSPKSGQIFLGGEEISQMSDSQLTTFRRRKIGFTIVPVHVQRSIHIPKTHIIIIRKPFTCDVS